MKKYYYSYSNIYLNTDFISNQKEEENSNKNKSILTRIVSHRKNNNINTNINKDNNKNENKYNSYNTQIKNDKKEIKEKEVKKVDNKKNNNIIQRKEEKIYIYHGLRHCNLFQKYEFWVNLVKYQLSEKIIKEKNIIAIMMH